MLNPTFMFDPGSQFTILETSINGAAGVPNVLGPATPVGINRLVFMGGVVHSDAAASHYLFLNLVNPQGNAAYPVDSAVVNVPASVWVPIARAIVVPPGWVVRGSSADAIGVGAVLSLRLLYLDYLIRTGNG